MQVKVRDRKTLVERTVTKKAYEIIPHRYDFLGYLDEDGNLTEGPAPQLKTVQKKTEAKSVVPVEAKIEVRPVLTKEDIEQKRAELNKMNDEAIKNAANEIPEKAPEPEVKTRRKPGPKPRTRTNA